MIDMDHLVENTRILYLLKDNCVMRHIAVFDVMPVYGFTGHLLHSITNSSCEGNNFITLTNGKSFSL